MVVLGAATFEPACSSSLGGCNVGPSPGVGWTATTVTPVVATFTATDGTTKSCTLSFYESYDTTGVSSAGATIAVDCGTGATSLLTMEDVRSYTTSHGSTSRATVQDCSTTTPVQIDVTAATGGSAAYPAMVTPDFTRALHVQATVTTDKCGRLAIDAQFTTRAADYAQIPGQKSCGD
jgi:hypothetical protein